jgi:hypothetical protein
MGLVSDAMATGRINKDQLSNQIQSMNSIIGNYGEIVSAPISSEIQAPIRYEQVRINENFTNLRDMAVDFQSGRSFTPKDFEPATINLKTITSELDVKINNYLKDLGSTNKKITNNFQELNRNTGIIILTNPKYALETQGNINYEITRKLTI